MSRSLTALAAVAVTFAGALTLATASPAQADAASCISYLANANEQSTARNEICIETEIAARNGSPQAAAIVCREAMKATLLPRYHAVEACYLAAYEN